MPVTVRSRLLPSGAVRSTLSPSAQPIIPASFSVSTAEFSPNSIALPVLRFLSVICSVRAAQSRGTVTVTL